MSAHGASRNADALCTSLATWFDSVELCEFGMLVDGRGRITGHTRFDGSRDGTRFHFEGPIQGMQRGDDRSGAIRVSLRIPIAGWTMIGDAAVFAILFDKSARLEFDGQVDSLAQLSGTWTLGRCSRSPACTARFAAVPTALAGAGWTLALQVVDRGDDALGGSAQILFGGGASCDFTIRGRYDARMDLARLSLSPTSPGCAGGSLQLQRVVAWSIGLAPAWLTQLRYTLFGIRRTTLVDSGLTSDGRQLLLDHYNDPTNYPLPPPR